MGGMRGSSLCSAISSNCFCFFLLPLTARIFEWGGYIHCHHFMTTHSLFHSFWNQPATPTVHLQSTSETPPQTSSCQIQRSLLSPQSSHLPCFSGFCEPSPSRLSSPQFQPPNACILESARPSFLICKVGLIKPIISVWPTHRQLPNCSPYFPHVSYCQICHAKSPCSESSSNIRRLESSDPIALHMMSPQAARSGPLLLHQQKPCRNALGPSRGRWSPGFRLASFWPSFSIFLSPISSLTNWNIRLM